MTVRAIKVGDEFLLRSEAAWSTPNRIHDERCRLLTNKRAKKCWCPRERHIEVSEIRCVVTAVTTTAFEYTTTEVLSVTNPLPTNPEGHRRVGLGGGMTWEGLTRDEKNGYLRWVTCAGCGEPWPCSDSKRTDISGRERAKHVRGVSGGERASTGSAGDLRRRGQAEHAARRAVAQAGRSIELRGER